MLPCVLISSSFVIDISQKDLTRQKHLIQYDRASYDGHISKRRTVEIVEMVGLVRTFPPFQHVLESFAILPVFCHLRWIA